MTWPGRPDKMCVLRDDVYYKFHDFKCGGNEGGICFEEEDCPVTHDEIHNKHCNASFAEQTTRLTQRKEKQNGQNNTAERMEHALSQRSTVRKSELDHRRVFVLGK